MSTPFWRYVLALLGTLAALVVKADDTPMEAVYHHPEYPPFVLMVHDGNEYIPYHVPDSVFNAIAGRTIFKVNRTELDLADDFLRQLVDSVLPLANRQELMLVGLDVRGAASPEGPYNNNVRLARGRTKALLDLMSTRLDSVQVSLANTEMVAEDYPYLLWLMEQNDDPDAPRVRSIIERCTMDHPAQIKRELMALDGSLLWSRLYLEYFPRLRAARVVLFFRRVYAKRIEAQAIPPVSLAALDIPGPDLTVRPLEFAPDCTAPRRHVLAVSSNLLYDAFYMPQYGWAPMPNVQLEYFPRSGNFTFLAGFLSPYYHRWHRHKFFQIRDYHLEVRRYFNPGERHLGAYLAAYANANKYGIGLSATKGWEGEGYGGALKAGYVWPLGHGRWRLDVHVAVGGYVTRYDPYVWGNPITGEIDGDYYYDYTGNRDDFHRRNHRFSWLGPTEIGLTFSFDLLYRRNHSRGWSFRSTEPCK